MTPSPLPDPVFPLDRLSIEAWDDPVVDRLGHDPHSTYVETFWLGVLGPSTTWLIRRLAAGLDRAPDGYVIDLAETARAIGIGGRGGRYSPFMRSLQRSTQFGLTQHRGPDVLAVRRRIPPLSRRLVERLPASLQEQHQAWLDHELRSQVDERRTRARRLALSLLELGEDDADTEQQLHRWRFHPAMAHEATRWARAELELRSAPTPPVAGPVASEPAVASSPR